jgi:hypothetical protein
MERNLAVGKGTCGPFYSIQSLAPNSNWPSLPKSSAYQRMDYIEKQNKSFYSLFLSLRLKINL